MKTIAFLIAALTITPALAQKPVSPKPAASAASSSVAKTVALTPDEKKTVDLAATKLENLQLRYTQLQTQFQQMSAKMQAEFKTEQASLNQALDAARKAHGLGADAVFTGTEADPQNPQKIPFAFTVSPKPAEPKK